MPPCSKHRNLLPFLACLLPLGNVLAEIPCPQNTRNLLLNGNFESPPGDEWFDFSARKPHLWGAFSISTQSPHDGRHALRLVLDSEKHTSPVRVLGAAQNVRTDGMPERLSGHYRVDDWQRGAQNQYIQVVLIVWNTGKLPDNVDTGNYQLAYVLAGNDTPPFNMNNRKFIFPAGTATRTEPQKGSWLKFAFNPREDFKTRWGIDPKDFEYIRVLFEVRYDGRKPDDPRAFAEVRYDDLYFGPP